MTVTVTGAGTGAPFTVVLTLPTGSRIADSIDPANGGLMAQSCGSDCGTPNWTVDDVSCAGDECSADANGVMCLWLNPSTGQWDGEGYGC
jgi:hypothetical protein